MNSTEVNTLTRAAGHLWKPAFLAAFAECGNATQAAAAAKIDPSTAYYARQADSEFREN